MEGLICDMDTLTCQPGCETDANCPAGWQCDTRRDESGLPRICVNPTCG